MSNFALVQQTFSGQSSSAAPFGAYNTAGNCIIAITWGAATVTDTNGNKYKRLVNSWSATGLAIWAAASIARGPNTVSVTSGVVLALEYSSQAPQYYVCPGHIEPGSGFDNQQNITSADSGDTASYPGSNFTSADEVLCVFAGSGSAQQGDAYWLWGFYPPSHLPTWSIPSGTLLWTGATEPYQGFGQYCSFGAVGHDDVANITGVYSNSPFQFTTDRGGSLTGNPSASACVFLNLTGGCLGGVKSTPGASAGRRPRGNIDMDQIQPRVLRGELTGDYIATHIGGYTTGNYPIWDKYGNLIDSGNAGNGGGLLTVNAPTNYVTVNGADPAPAIKINGV